MGAFVVIATGAVAVPAQAAATLIQVSTTVDAPVAADCYDGVPGTSLRQALCLADAAPEAVVVLPPGTFTLTAGPLVVDPGGPLDLTLHGPGASMATIDAGGVSRVLDVDPSLTGGVHLIVEGVTLRGGVGEPGTGGGGAILAGTGDPTAPDSLTLRDCAVTANRNAPAGTALPSDVGGAVSMTGGALLVERCTFTGNTASGAAGGAIGYSGVGGADTVEVVGSTFTGNTVEAAAAAAAAGGGALDVAWGAPTTTVRSTRFETNELRTGTRPARGSAVRVAAGTATLEGVTVRRNQAVGGTGSTAAVHLAAGTVSDSVVVGNVTDVGGVQTRAGVAGASSALRTWWGCTDLAGACDSAGGALVEPFATIATSLAPAAAVAGQSVTATVTVGLSDGSASTPALRTAMTGAPVTWSGATFTAAGTALDAAGTAQASLTAAGSATVSATVDGASAGAALTVAAAPAVTDEPVDATVSEGAAATFTATATGAPAPTVQWQVRENAGASWSDAVGGTSTTFTTETLVRGDHGMQVRAVFTSSAGTATTRAASVTVTYGPEDVTGPGDAAGLVGSVVTFSASAAGRPTPTVRWQTSPDGTTWADVAGATSWTYSRTLLAGDEGLRVRAVVSGAGGDVPTSSAGVTLQSAPTVSAQPTDVAVLPNTAATFVVGASGVPAPTVAWERRAPGGSWQAVPGSSTTLTLPGVPLADHGTQLRATLTNLHGSVTSDVATLSVLHGPVVTQHPADVAGVVGEVVTSTAAATGHPAPTVQWQTSSNGGISWSNVPGATSWTWTRTLTQGDDGLQVRAWVTGHDGSVATGTAFVTARYAPTVTAPAHATVAAGDDASFTVTVTGSPTPTVTWQRRAAGAASWTDAGTGTSLVLEDVTPADHGTQVRAVAISTQGSMTSAAATLTVHWAPTFTQHPAATTVLAGEVATFTAAGNGNPTPVVRWQTSTDGTTWADVPGATSWTYARTTTVADDGLRVRVVASGWTGDVASSSAVLTVEHAPTITTQPQAASVLAGDDATFTLAVTGNPVPAVAWQTQVPGGAWTAAGTGASLTLTDLRPADDGTRVRAIVTNSRGAVTSDDVELDVRWAPVLTAHPADVTGLADDEVTFTAAATGNPAVSPTWQTSGDGTSWTTVPGATAWTYTRTLTDADHGLQVRAVATNAEGVALSDVAHVTVDAAPAVTAQPADATVDLGTDATFEVTVTGRPAPAVQWQTQVDGDWVDVPGATATTLVVPGDEDAHGTRYRAVATNLRGTATSDVVTLAVLLPPTVTDPQDVATAPGEEVTFRVDVTGRPVPDVTWEASDDGVTWTPVGTGTALALTPTLADDGLLVRAVATATLVAGPVAVTSAAAELVVAEVPEVLDGPGPLTTVTAGVPTTLAWTVRAADATARWDVSRDGGATWTPVPVGWTPGTEAVRTAARAAGPAVRTVHTLALTPTAADEGALVRLTVTSPGGAASASTVLDVVAVVDPGTGGSGTGSGAGDGGTGAGAAPAGPTAPGVTSPTAPAGSGASSLPRTGADPLALLALGTLLAAAGVVTAVAATRRRELRA